MPNPIDINDRAPTPNTERDLSYVTDAAHALPACPGDRVTTDTDVGIKVCKLWFHEPYLESQEIVNLLEAEHPAINSQGVTTILKNSLRTGLVTAQINYPSGSDRLRENTDLTSKVCKLWLHYPHLSARDIVLQLKDEHPHLNAPERVTKIVKTALRKSFVTANISYDHQWVDLLTLETDLLRAFPRLQVVKIAGISSRCFFDDLDEEARREARRDLLLRLAPLAAGIIEKFLRAQAIARPQQATIVGVCWGSTLYYLWRYLAGSVRRPLRSPLDFVPTIGQPARPQELGLDAYNLATRFAEIWGGRAWSLSCPALMTNGEARDAVRFTDVARVMRMLAQTHLVINSVAPVANGAVGNLRLSKDPDVNGALLQSNRWQDACGRIGLSFFDTRGFPIELKHHRAVGMDLELLQRVALDPNRMALTITGGDPARIPALLGALRGDLISHLLTDEFTARAMLDAERLRYAPGS